MSLLDTIAAVSTPYGKGGIAVLRISGADAISVAEKVFLPKSKRPLSEYEANRAVYGSIFGNKNGEKVQIDDGIAVIFRAPASFTGEDTVEISCHGGILLTQRVLESILTSGARLAEAGEFTRRAFINGKMSLTGAEALGELLSASSDDQITLARSGLEGRLSFEAERIYGSLCDILAAIYAHIDYPDEDLADIPRDEMLKVARENLASLQKLSRTYSTAHAIGEGIPTVILGRTNAGKSTLYNRIVGRDAAIVTDIEGTTRDILTETAHLGRVTLRLSDTAGLRATAEYINSLNGIKVALINKSDLGACPELDPLLTSFSLTLPISAENGEGFGALVAEIEKIYIDNELDMGQSAIIANARQNASVLNAISSLSGAIEAIESELPLEICCVEVENSLSALGELDGRTVTEDIISKIFLNFCVGK